MTSAEREELFRRYEAGPQTLRTALAQIPQAAMQWRPAENTWSAHEVIVHCADSETISAGRIRYLVGEPSPVIAGYAEAKWAVTMNYHALPLELSLRQIDTVRAWTAAFIRSLPESAWTKTGRHTDMADPYTAETWLRIYAEHLEIHARQLLRNLEAWKPRA